MPLLKLTLGQAFNHLHIFSVIVSWPLNSSLTCNRYYMKMINDIYNFLPITYLLSRSGQPTEAQLSVLAEEGYELIINLALHDDPRYSLKDEPSYVKSLGIEYIHIPVQFDKPLKSDLVSFFNAVESNKNKKIHIHCAANMRVTAEDAFKPMWQIWKPDSVWSSFIDSMAAEFLS